jgi:hypothetical protein
LKSQGQSSKLRAFYDFIHIWLDNQGTDLFVGFGMIERFTSAGCKIKAKRLIFGPAGCDCSEVANQNVGGHKVVNKLLIQAVFQYQLHLERWLAIQKDIGACKMSCTDEQRQR